MTDNELLLAMSKQLEAINNRLDTMDNRLDTMDNRLDTMDKRFDKTDDTLNTLKFNQEHITEKLKGIEVTMNYNDYHLSHDIKKLQEDVATISGILKINNRIPIAR